MKTWQIVLLVVLATILGVGANIFYTRRATANITRHAREIAAENQNAVNHRLDSLDKAVAVTASNTTLDVAARLQETRDALAAQIKSAASDVATQSGQRLATLEQSLNAKLDALARPPAAGAKGADAILKAWTFKNEADLHAWSTDFIWETNPGRVTKGTVSLSDEYGGSARVSVSGAPSVIDFSTQLPFDLRPNDEVVVAFATKVATDPISGFVMELGPAKPNGHAQSIFVTTQKGGSYTARMPVYIVYYKAGTPVGIHMAVWPGEMDIYIKSVSIVRHEQGLEK